MLVCYHQKVGKYISTFHEVDLSRQFQTIVCTFIKLLLLTLCLSPECVDKLITYHPAAAIKGNSHTPDGSPNKTLSQESETVILVKMLAILLGCLAAAAAAPHYPHGPPPYAPEHHQHFGQYDPFEEDVFDTRQFWAQMANEMRQIDEMLSRFSQSFPTMVSQAGIEGKEYKIIITLNGFEEKDIVVKAKEGFLMVQAIHKLPEGGETMYLDAKTIPNCVNVTGTWTFEQGVLKIVFPLKNDGEGSEAVTQVAVTEVVVTEQPTTREREEMESKSTEEVLTGELDEMLTNEIPQNRVEATTYSVDLKDEVEFVPVRNYKRN